MAHQAATDFGDDGCVAVAIAAGLVRHAQVAGIEEAHELRRFLVERGIRARRIGGGAPQRAIAGRHVRGSLIGGVGVAAVALDAGQLHRGRGVHRLDAHVALCGIALRKEGRAGQQQEEQAHQKTILTLTKAEKSVRPV